MLKPTSVMYRNFEEIELNWKFYKELGSGAFGDVSLWINTETGLSVAIKRCSVDLDKLALDEKCKLKTRWHQESEWMRSIDIENIVRACPELCTDLVAGLNKLTKLPVIAMEYCDGGNLRSKLHMIENVNGFNEYDVRQVLGALRKAVYHLHDRYKITHRDIKPDNIVIKYSAEGVPIYKLTDMGYARMLDKETIVGSMVGSRNYFAPEIVESAEYKNSVDYWSMGIVAFEITCGVYPFLQDGTMYETLMSIKKKPPGCIAITKSNNETLYHHTHLFPENRLSKAFCRVIEPWLQLALEADGRKRGYEASDEVQIYQQPKLTFYTKLDDALNVKVLTVFWLNRCRFLSYVVDKNMTMNDLCNALEIDTDVVRSSFYFVLPAGHSLDNLTPQVEPLDLYEEKFYIEDKIMLYLIDFKTGALCTLDDPSISEPIRLTFDVSNRIQPRILKQSLLNTLFYQFYELRRVVECVNGIHEFSMNLESEIMKQEHDVNMIHDQIIHLKGQATQFQAMVFSANLLLKEKQINCFEHKDVELGVNVQDLTRQYSNIKFRLKSALNRIREFMKTSPLKTYQQDLHIHVKQFQAVFEEVRNKARPISPEEIRDQFSSFLKARKVFFDNTNKYLRHTDKSKSTETLIEIYFEYQTITKILLENKSLWNNCCTQMAEKTTTFLSKLVADLYNHDKNVKSPVHQIIENMDTLNIDNEEFLVTNIQNNGESVLELPTDNLIKDSKVLTEALASLLNA